MSPPRTPSTPLHPDAARVADAICRESLPGQDPFPLAVLVDAFLQCYEAEAARRGGGAWLAGYLESRAVLSHETAIALTEGR
jgi:hypothetical protein